MLRLCRLGLLKIAVSAYFSLVVPACRSAFMLVSEFLSE